MLTGHAPQCLLKEVNSYQPLRLPFHFNVWTSVLVSALVPVRSHGVRSHVSPWALGASLANLPECAHRGCAQAVRLHWATRPLS